MVRASSRVDVRRMLILVIVTVRLGNSGLKVSKIILGCMSYGSPEWQGWVLKEEEGLKHIKAACVLVIYLVPTSVQG